MRLCELQKLHKERGKPHLQYTDETMQCYLANVGPEMVGAILEISKLPGKWALTKVDENDLEYRNIRSCLFTPKAKEQPAKEVANEVD